MDAPDVDTYKNAFSAISDRLTPEQREMLRKHYESPACLLTSTELANAGGYDNFEAANSQYGRVGALVAAETGFRPGQASSSIATFYKPESGEWRWELRPQVVKALEELGWFTRDSYPAKVQPG
jgi:hypothetical protein